jgi:hypothetical protein
MSDPFIHFGVGFMTGLVGDYAIFEPTGHKIKNPLIVPVLSGVAAVLVDLDHLPRLIEAGGSYTKLILEAKTFSQIDNYHSVFLAVVAFFTFISFIVWQSARANKLEYETSRAGWVFCSLATLTTVIITHLVMDFLIQCTLWPAVRCGLVGG